MTYHPMHATTRLHIDILEVVNFNPNRGFGFAVIHGQYDRERFFFHISNGYEVTAQPWHEHPMLGYRNGESRGDDRVAYGVRVPNRRTFLMSDDIVARRKGSRELARWWHLLEYQAWERRIANPPRRRVVRILHGTVVEILWEGTDILELSDLWPQVPGNELSEAFDKETRWWCEHSNEGYPQLDGLFIQRAIPRQRRRSGSPDIDWIHEEDVRAPVCVVEARKALDKSSQ